MKFIKVWTDFTKSMEPLKDAERGRLFTAMLIYAEQSTEPELVGNERFIWPTVKAEIDRQKEAYRHQCEVNKANITTRYDSLRTVTNRYEPLRVEAREDKDKDKDKDKEKKKKTPFAPPTVEEVAEYCRERHNKVNPNRFYAWYSANGWKVGKNPMKDWKAAVRTWEDDKDYQDGKPKKAEYDRYADVKIN